MAKIYMDSIAQSHIPTRIRERIKDPMDQERMVSAVRKLLTMEAPPEAVGHYDWYINVGHIGRIIFRGISIRTVYSFDERYPDGTEYRIIGDRVVRT